MDEHGSPAPEHNPLGHTFHILRENAGLFGLGVEVAVMEDGVPTGSAVVYGDTLHMVRLHMDAEVAWLVSGTGTERIMETNSMLPKHLQRPHPAV